MPSSAPTVRAALVTALRGLSTLTDVLVCYGVPGKYQPNDILAVMPIASTHEVATLATSRPREETLQATVIASCYRGGDDPLGDTQKLAYERAYVLLGIVEEYVRNTDPTIGGTVRGLLGEVDIRPSEEFSIADDGINVGRIAEVEATFTLYARW